MVVFGQKWLYSDKVVVFGQSGCNRAKSGCNRTKWLCSDRSGGIRVKWLYSGKKWLHSAKVVIFG